MTVSSTETKFEPVKFIDRRVTVRLDGSTSDTSRTNDSSVPPTNFMSQRGALCLHVISRSVRSCVGIPVSELSSREH